MPRFPNMVNEAHLDAMKRRGWVERTRLPLLSEGRTSSRSGTPAKRSAKAQTATGPRSRRSEASRSRALVRASSLCSRPSPIQETSLSMSAPYNPNIDLHVGRGSGLHLQINDRPVDNTYGAIVMAELAGLRDEFPAVRVVVTYRCATRPTPAIMARLINTELDRNEIWD